MVFFFQAEDGIRDSSVTGVQTCALPIFGTMAALQFWIVLGELYTVTQAKRIYNLVGTGTVLGGVAGAAPIGRAACRGRGEISGVAGSFKKKKREGGGRGVVRVMVR